VQPKIVHEEEEDEHSKVSAFKKNPFASSHLWQVVNVAHSKHLSKEQP
jgi:hypothetical protein